MKSSREAKMAPYHFDSLRWEQIVMKFRIIDDRESNKKLSQYLKSIEQVEHLF